MGSTNERDDRGKFRRHVRSADFEVIRMIAETMRSEFGGSIDAHPGGVGHEAGAINRAFRMTAYAILKGAGSLEDDLAGVRMRLLRQVALGRLQELGVESTQAVRLLDQEPKLGEAWLAYLALAPGTVIDDLMGREPDD